MARWNKILDLSDWWEGLPLDDGTIQEWTGNNVHKFAKRIARKIAELYPRQLNTDCPEYDWNLDDVVDHFLAVLPPEEFSKEVHAYINEEIDILITPMEDFDYAMSELYDWADRHGLWVKTVF